ncbi:hypothetical protein CQA53_11405 [Helicobacter didelphidarum]|uniref:Uncharacterized protein n=1 Tax=Helicobacter didelphidarum TaxID=2040648 RepID=A0A3D8I310_9HELI|nr:hypothetical protein [Helicobacter didelphidarum]RDU59497.1 hypothetical protein CQA53_11405 [Helicobacter didelphidarum]
MKEKENINENKQELESKDLESSTNPKEIKLDSKNNTETKNQNSKNNTESYIKLDSNGDEIIWELEKNRNLTTKLGQFWFYGLRIVFAIFIIKIIDKYLLGRYDIQAFIATIILLLCLLYLLSGVVKSINFKKLYITNNTLVIKKYLGQDIVLPLGSFCIYESNDYIGVIFFNDTIDFLGFDKKIKYSLFQIEFADDTCKKISEILKPHIISYLSSLKDKDYLNIKSPKNIFGSIPYFDEIDSLRKEANNG